MTTTKSLFVAVLLSTVAAVSFAQTPAMPMAAGADSAPAVAKVPADAASKPPASKKQQKTHAKKAAATPAAPAASAAK
jgi:hypothetical protein